MRKYKLGSSRLQTALLPPSIDEYVSKSNPVRALDAYVDTLDLACMGVKNSQIGRRAGNIDNTFYMPGYARVDAMLKYQHKIGPSNVTFQFNVENLLDKEYMSASNGGFAFIHQVMPGAPRTFLGSVRVEV
ncbi:MAG: TonB-dependent receptor [Methylococcales bacterium]